MEGVKEKILNENHLYFNEFSEDFIDELILLQADKGKKFLRSLGALSQSSKEISEAVVLNIFIECIAEVMEKKKKNRKK